MDGVTRPALVAAQVRQGADRATVCALDGLARAGPSRSAIRAHIDAARWQRVGRAVVLHTGPLSRREWMAVALINAGPGALLTAFTALEVLGLTGWARPEFHVLIPRRGAGAPIAGMTVRRHYAATWPAPREPTVSGVHRRGEAVLRAVADLVTVRAAMGLLAAVVTQRIVTVQQLRPALTANTRQRHRAALLAALDDIDQGSQALSEIDFVRLCRRYRLPTPAQQAVRLDAQGRRRYLDASWTRADGSVLAVEVDGAHHLTSDQRAADVARQNDLVVRGVRVLRFYAWQVREDADYVAATLAGVSCLA